MSYATRDNMLKRFGAKEIDDMLHQASGDQDERAAILQTALDDADSEINASLAVTYALPLKEATWPQLVAVACDLARARLYDDAPPENVIRRQRSARSRLRSLANGNTRLVAADGSQPKRIGSVAAVGDVDPKFTGDALDNY